MVRFVRFAIETVVILAAGSLIAALLFRLAPGADVDSREMNPRLSESTKDILRQKRASLHQVAGTSFAYYKGVLRGDFGTSETSGRPVSELLRERVPSTVLLVLFGSTVSLFIAFASALAVNSIRSVHAGRLPAAMCSCLLALPSGLVVLLAVTLGAAVEIALVAIVAPRLYPYCSRFVSERLKTEHILNAECMGIPWVRVLLNQLLPGLVPEIAGLFSLSVVTALSVSVAVEVLGARTGLGELAWRAAMDRDMPVVLAVTMILLLVVRLGTSTSDLLFAVGQQHYDAKVVSSAADNPALRVALRA